MSLEKLRSASRELEEKLDRETGSEISVLRNENAALRTEMAAMRARMDSVEGAVQSGRKETENAIGVVHSELSVHSGTLAKLVELGRITEHVALQVRAQRY